MITLLTDRIRTACPECVSLYLIKSFCLMYICFFLLTYTVINLCREDGTLFLENVTSSQSLSLGPDGGIQTDFTGLVAVCADGSYGTICRNDFDDTDAALVCRLFSGEYGATGKYHIYQSVVCRLFSGALDATGWIHMYLCVVSLYPGAGYW